ncbi:MAG: hypothetical protein WC322_04815, partial [Candidatus Paceibacterota bacterium]
MKSILVVFSILAFTAFGYVGAVSDMGSGQNQANQQAQTANQGENSQIQTQNSEQLQEGLSVQEAGGNG